ncbi:MAG TPA: response regulator [Pirellulales bacterium]|nr:response regulator [Pirellulales bacterium]
MLVLSRRPSEKVVFPTVNATIEVIQVRGRTVRLGITAPPDVPVARHEILTESGAVADFACDANATIRKLRHLMRNQLQLTSVGLAVMRGQILRGNWQELDATLARLEQECSSARDRCESLERPEPAPPAAPLTALVVEDNHNERELLASFLRISGFDVATASDGADALDYLSNQRRPDVVLLDLMMPRCDGPSTVREIRTNPRWEGLKIFAVSGTSPSEVQLSIGPSGLDGWFSKPVNPQAMVRQLSRQLAASGA